MPATIRESRRKALTTLAVAVLLVFLGYFVVKVLGDQLNAYLIAQTSYRRTTATVPRKDHARFDEQNRRYLGDFGDRIEASPQDEQWQDFYEFDTFDQLGEPVRSRVSAHGRREARSRPAEDCSIAPGLSWRLPS